MQSQIGGTVALIVAVPFTLGMLAAAGVAIAGRLEDDKEASALWKANKLRNGVTAPSPFHASHSPINAPSLVEVRPLSQQAEHCTQTLPIPFQAPKPIPASIPENPDSQPLRSVAARVPQSDRSALAAIDEINREAVIGLVSQGISKTKVIKQIWGCSPGGSQKYKDARAQYEAILSEVSSNA